VRQPGTSRLFEAKRPLPIQQNETMFFKVSIDVADTHQRCAHASTIFACCLYVCSARAGYVLSHLSAVSIAHCCAIRHSTRQARGAVSQSDQPVFSGSTVCICANPRVSRTEAHVLLCMLILLNAFPDVIHRGLAPRLDPSMWAVLMKVSLAIVDDLLQVRLDWCSRVIQPLFHLH